MKEERRSSIEVEIMGQKFNLVSENDEEYVRKVASYVEKRIQESESIIGTASSLNIAILTAMNIADDYFSETKKQKVAIEELLGKSKRLISFIDERLT